MSGLQPVFVVGYMHSGTTLVRNLLVRAPGVYASAGETKYFDLRDLVVRRFARLDDPDVRARFLRFLVDLIEGRDRLEVFLRPDYEPETPSGRVADLVGPPEQLETHDGLFVRAFDALAREAGADTWVEKTPSNVNHVERIVAAAPDARFVEIVRDPRDLVASKKTRRRNALEGDRYSEDLRATKRLANAYDPAWDALAWRAAVRAGARAAERHPGRVHRVRYEDLVARPAEETREVCRFLGLEYDDAMLEVRFRNEADRARRRERPLGASRPAISQTSVGRWRDTLDPVEAALCQWVAGGDARRLGYGGEPIPPLRRARAVLRLGRSALDLGARVVRRWRLGGARLAGVVLLSYARRLPFLGRRR